MIADDNAFGVTGMADQATIGMTNASDSGSYDLADAINIAAGALAPGDVMLIEQQTAGANGGCDATGQTGCVAVEFVQAFYDAIVAATAAGVIVVEAAGNGGQDLDSAAYNPTFGTQGGLRRDHRRCRQQPRVHRPGPRAAAASRRSGRG